MRRTPRSLFVILYLFFLCFQMPSSTSDSNAIRKVFPRIKNFRAPFTVAHTIIVLEKSIKTLFTSGCEAPIIQTRPRPQGQQHSTPTIRASPFVRYIDLIQVPKKGLRSMAYKKLRGHRIPQCCMHKSCRYASRPTQGIALVDKCHTFQNPVNLHTLCIVCLAKKHAKKIS